MDRECNARRARSRYWPVLFTAIFLAVLVGMVFYPVPSFQFIDYDVPRLVIRNPQVHSLSNANLRHIFGLPHSGDYSPASTLWLAVDYQIWGPAPFGFKLTNLSLHLLNVLLVFGLVLRLKRSLDVTEQSVSSWHALIPAILAAGLFAVHPVVVEPVTWVAGRGVLLTALGALSCMHFHDAAHHVRERHGSSLAEWSYHIGAIGCCGIACLASPLGLVVPALATSWDLLASKRPQLRAVVRDTAWLWLIGTALLLAHTIGSNRGAILGAAPPASAEHLCIVLNTYWLHLRTLFWSGASALLLPPVEPSGFLDPQVMLGGLAVGATALLIWIARRQKAVLLGLVWFLLTFGPNSQMIPQEVYQADRHLYLPLVGLAVALAACYRPLQRIMNRRIATRVFASAGAALLVVLSIAAAVQVRTWQSSSTVFENCLVVAPHNALARWAASQQGGLRSSNRTDSSLGDIDDPETLGHAAIEAATATDQRASDYQSAIPLVRRGCQLTQWNQPRYLHLLATIYSASARSLVGSGELRRAVRHYRIALEAKPDHLPTLLQLATVLATSKDKDLRNPREAVLLAQKAQQVIDEPNVGASFVLAAIYAEAWEFDTAIFLVEQAIDLAHQSGQIELEKQLGRRLELYRRRIPPEISRY